MVFYILPHNLLPFEDFVARANLRLSDELDRDQACAG